MLSFGKTSQLRLAPRKGAFLSQGEDPHLSRDTPEVEIASLQTGRTVLYFYYDRYTTIDVVTIDVALSVDTLTDVGFVLSQGEDPHFFKWRDD